MIQPNFLDLAWRVRRSIELTQEHPAAKSSQAYGAHLQKALDIFNDTTESTDLTYNGWRAVRGEQMTAFRDLRLESDRTRALCDEHALDNYPTQRIVYTEEEELIAFIQSAIEYLQEHQEEWSWVPTQIQKLQAGIDGAAALKKKEKDEYKNYVQRAKERVSAYDQLYALFRDFLRDAKNDIADTDTYQEIQLSYS